MIHFDFTYIVPETAEEAVSAWFSSEQQGENPVYYSGGTEIITLCREQKIEPHAVIDIKQIPECLKFSETEDYYYGAALTLNTITEKTSLSLFSAVLSRIADNTIRNKLTLGGNIMGRLPFREAVLPLLLLDAHAVIAGKEGTRSQPLSMVFEKRLLLGKGELLLGITFPEKTEAVNWVFTRKEKNGRIDYPILSACFLKENTVIKMAVSGSFAYPLRNLEAEKILNRQTMSPLQRAEKVADHFADYYKTDFRSSAAYRKHLLKGAITEALEKLEE